MTLLIYCDILIPLYMYKNCENIGFNYVKKTHHFYKNFLHINIENIFKVRVIAMNITKNRELLIRIGYPNSEGNWNYETASFAPLTKTHYFGEHTDDYKEDFKDTMEKLTKDISNKLGQQYVLVENKIGMYEIQNDSQEIYACAEIVPEPVYKGRTVEEWEAQLNYLAAVVDNESNDIKLSSVDDINTNNLVAAREQAVSEIVKIQRILDELYDSLYSDNEIEMEC